VNVGQTNQSDSALLATELKAVDKYGLYLYGGISHCVPRGQQANNNKNMNNSGSVAELMVPSTLVLYEI
jgi:hypothetical protein